MSGYRRSFPKGTSERMCALMSEARNISELKRAQCIYFRSEHGLPPQQIADMVGFDVGTARNLHSAFLRDGEAALKLSGKGGRYHAYLTEEEESSWLEGFRDAGENGGILEVGRCPSSKSLGRLSLFCNGGSGSPWIDVRPLFVDGSSGVSGSSVF